MSAGHYDPAMDVPRGQKIALRAGSVVVLLALWLYATEVAGVRPLFVPGPSDLVERWGAIDEQLPSAMKHSLTIIFGGFFFGCGAGIFAGLLMAFSPRIREASETLINAVRPVPIFALIPLFLLWFGIGQGSQIGLVAFGCFVILVVSTSEAIKNVPVIYLNAGRTLGADRRRLFATIIVPAIVPGLVGAVRVAAAASFGLDVAAEFIGAQNGLGYLLINMAQYLYTDGIIIIIAIYTVFALLLDRLVVLASQRVTRWSGRAA
jgi:ABC-type nitrate/sulfonate/bicarbonate transport system permease component